MAHPRPPRSPGRRRFARSATPSVLELVRLSPDEHMLRVRPRCSLDLPAAEGCHRSTDNGCGSHAAGTSNHQAAVDNDDLPRHTTRHNDLAAQHRDVASYDIGRGNGEIPGCTPRTGSIEHLLHFVGDVARDRAQVADRDRRCSALLGGKGDGPAEEQDGCDALAH